MINIFCYSVFRWFNVFVKYDKSDYGEKQKRLKVGRIRLTKLQESLDQREETLSRMRSYNNERLLQEGKKQCAYLNASDEKVLLFITGRAGKLFDL